MKPEKPREPTAQDWIDAFDPPARVSWYPLLWVSALIALIIGVGVVSSYLRFR